MGEFPLFRGSAAEEFKRSECIADAVLSRREKVHFRIYPFHDRVDYYF